MKSRYRHLIKEQRYTISTELKRGKPHAAKYPELRANIGNAGLLKAAAAQGIIDAELADQVISTYLMLRIAHHSNKLAGQVPGYVKLGTPQAHTLQALIPYINRLYESE
jgi:glutamine synthetase adenylyltransferase